MNRRACACVGLTVGPIVGPIISFLAWSSLIVSTVSAQPAPSISGSAGSSIGAGIKPDIKNAPSAEPFRGTIDAFIKGQLPALTGDDPIAQKAAREKLINECTSSSTQSYFDVYAELISDNVTPFLAPGKSTLRVRVNIAVLVGQVSSIGKTAKAEPAVILLVNDPLEPVALKGMQAARYVLQIVDQNPAQIPGDKLIATILPAVKQHAKSGLIAADAYHALIPDVTPVLNQNQGTAAAPLLLDSVLDLLHFRATIYATAVADTPTAEAPLPSFFSHSYFLQTVNAKQRLRIVQELVNLVSMAGDQLATASKAEVTEVIPLLRNAAQTLLVIEKDKRGETFSDPVLVDVINMQLGTAGPQVSAKTKPVFGALQSLFPTLLPVPSVTPAAPSTAPGSPTSQTATNAH